MHGAIQLGSGFDFVLGSSKLSEPHKKGNVKKIASVGMLMGAFKQTRVPAMCIFAIGGWGCNSAGANHIPSSPFDSRRSYRPIDQSFMTRKLGAVWDLLGNFLDTPHGSYPWILIDEGCPAVFGSSG